MHVLIIDDHRLFSAGLELIVKGRFQQAQVRVADSVEAAIALPAEMPELVLLDINLNGMDGVSGASVIKARWPACTIIMISSEIDAERIAVARRVGVDAVLSKADPPARILATIESLVDAGPTPAGKAALTPRQADIMRLIESGLSNKAIARQLDLSEFTVRGHVQAIMRALGVNTRTGAVFAARQAGLI